MKVCYKICLFYFLVFSNYSQLKAQQDYELMDSLIKLNLFPIQYPVQNIETSRNILDSNEYDKLYSFILREKTTQRRVDYILGKDTTVTFGDPKLFSVRNSVSIWDSIVFIPKVHLSFFYAYTFRRKDDNYKYINFFIDHFIKNAADSTWKTNDYSINLKIYNDEAELKRSTKFGPLKRSKGSQNEGWVSTGLNEMDYESKIELWNHFNPNMHYYSIEVLDKSGKPYEYFYERIGFRDIRMQAGEMLINNHKIEFKSAQFASKNLRTDSLEKQLRKLKVNNFNTIILTNRAPEVIFNLCDSIGLNVIQELNGDSFYSLSSLLDYFESIKGSPSFIAWYDAGLNDAWLKILKRLDQYRPIIKDRILFGPVIENWAMLELEKKAEIKIRFQTFSFYFIPDSSILKIGMEEFFKYTDKIELNWMIKESDLVIKEGTSQNLIFKKNEMEIRIPIEIAKYKSPEYTYEFQLTITANCYPYQKGDVIASGKSQYVLRDGQLIYKVIY